MEPKLLTLLKKCVLLCIQSSQQILNTVPIGHWGHRNEQSIVQPPSAFLNNLNVRIFDDTLNKWSSSTKHWGILYNYAGVCVELWTSLPMILLSSSREVLTHSQKASHLSWFGLGVVLCQLPITASCSHSALISVSSILTYQTALNSMDAVVAAMAANITWLKVIGTVVKGLSVLQETQSICNLFFFHDWSLFPWTLVIILKPSKLP